MRRFIYQSVAIISVLLQGCGGDPSRVKYEPWFSFEDFPVNAVYNGRKAPLDLTSTEIEPEYASLIAEAYEKEPVNFSGHYCLIRYDCGAPCQNFILVDAANGNVFDGFIAENGYLFNSRSRMIIANPPDSLGYYDARCSYCMPEIRIWNEITKSFTQHTPNDTLAGGFRNVTFRPKAGERLSVTGDFNGDGAAETLTEQYISRLTNREACKVFEPLHLPSRLTADQEIMLTDTLMTLICNQEPVVRLVSGTDKIPPLTLPYFCNLTGFAYLIDVGNVNKVKGDELAIVTSSIRFAGVTDECMIYSFTKNGWNKVFSFTIREDSYEKSDCTTQIPGYLEKRDSRWYYRDDRGEVTGSNPEGKSGVMVLLRVTGDG